MVGPVSADCRRTNTMRTSRWGSKLASGRHGVIEFSPMTSGHETNRSDLAVWLQLSFASSSTEQVDFEEVRKKMEGRYSRYTYPIQDYRVEWAFGNPPSAFVWRRRCGCRWRLEGCNSMGKEQPAWFSSPRDHSHNLKSRISL